MNINETIGSLFKSKKEYAPLFIRIMAGFHLVYGVQDNVFSWDRMVEFEKFLSAHSFPLPLVCAIVCVYAQLICGLLFIAGLFTRTAALVMVFNFIVAILAIHIGDTYRGVFPAIVMLSSSLFLLFNGAGKFSLDK
ncbi:MAG TPA: DoxX family protein [Cyclobacteriaceae bacterium]